MNRLRRHRILSRVGSATIRARRLPLVLVAGLGLWGLGGPTLATAAGGAPVGPPAVVAGSRYLALGDSVTFGYEESAVVPAPNYKKASTFLGYPELLARELHLTLSNPSCPGETSSSLINPHAQSNGCENSPGTSRGYRTLFPLHVHYKGSQLAYALHYLRAHHNVSLVSLMIGANDGFVCISTTKDHCSSKADRAALTRKITHNVHKILGTIRGKAHYRGQLVIVNYYAPSPADNSLAEFLNGIQDSAAKPYHVRIADGYDQFRVADKHFGYNACTAGLVTQLGKPGVCGIHPSYAGQALLAEAVLKVIRVG
jgi:lysophospholipase L1-like esterase